MLTAVAVCFVLLISCQGGKKKSEAASLKGKKIFYLDSYHHGYEPNVPSKKTIEASLSAKGLIYECFYMNTKFESSKAQISANSAIAREKIRNFSPDLIIAADDPALDYVICPYFAGLAVPVVFTGVNWVAPKCAGTAPNITGQVEVEFIKELVDFLKPYAKSEKLFFLQGDTETDRKSLNYYEKHLGLKPEKSIFVRDFEQWKRAYKRLQSDPGIVIFRNNSGITGWQDSQAVDFVTKETKNPSGSVSIHMWKFCMVSYAKDHYEFGEYASKTAFEILGKKKQMPLPLEKNTRVRKILNMNIANNLGIEFPPEVLEDAWFAGEKHD